MAEINSVLVTSYGMKPENQKKLCDALAPAQVIFCTPRDREIIEAHIQDVDVAILAGDADDLILSGRKLKWIHCCHAGLDKTMRPDIFERGIILTSSSGRSAPALAEHVLMFMLTLTYDIPDLLQAQKEHRWAVSRERAMKTGLYKKTVGIVGLGKTGQEVARLAKQFDMRTLGWRRSDVCPENVDRIYSSDKGEGIDELLRESDYVVLCAALNDSTWHIINEQALSQMKSSAFLINIGRGGLVDEPALAVALSAGVIAGAGLDTVEKEPLPVESPLWDMPNVIITPHMTPMVLDREERALDYVFQNIKAYRGDGKFVNRLSLRDMYTVGKK